MKAASPEKRFHAELLALYDACASHGFRPVLLRRYVVLNGGVKAAKELVFKPGTTGLERLVDIGRPELSMEAMMLRPEYLPLFSPAEVKEARERLAGNTRSRSRGRLPTKAS
ncbi:hypothetical protein MRS76_16855 [Rhizobiaceae bacterium n13]|uniref:Uncharacterized protein n=1 Tax=Ferirhizobium litorale TaxID=2927786 RepID=A0AAE3QHG5_9HYPH|nr:hypothetical protein [Fererhizobium litorale]MDI7863628.1 hypothetical protein [Fererhizobium litorale]MDI7923451.1 hypothetical protein [Fererhizobium litorale]